ncbi:MAG: hypothetical protein ACR2NN_22340 [Bryobacteraceae bacterium]
MYVHCSGCGLALSDVLLERHAAAPCLACGAETLVSVFPAALNMPINPAQDRLTTPGAISEGTASCFYHEQRAAVIPCAGCGRFLCSLCEVELAGQHWCPECLMSGRKASTERLEPERTLYDSIALALVTWPLLIFYFTLITAPAALVLSIKYWSKPTSLVRRSKWRLWVAAAVAVLQLIGWVALIAFFLVKVRPVLQQRPPVVITTP